MKQSCILSLLLLACATTRAVAQARPTGSSMGPLSVAPGGYYFQTPGGQPIYLAGSHTWTTQQDRINAHSRPTDFSAYLTFLKSEHGNFMRDWEWDNSQDYASPPYSAPYANTPLPWARSATQCCAADGGLKFDLTQYDDSGYFDRLRQRVRLAAAGGVYVSVMLFQGWSETPGSYAWSYSAWNGNNNVNRINPPDGRAVFNGSEPAIVRLEKAYICHVVQAVGNEPNVLYEIANETSIYNDRGTDDPTIASAIFQWQQDMVNQVRNCESSAKPSITHRPVGITSLGNSCDSFTNITNGWLLRSNADWISPGGGSTNHNDVDNYEIANFHATGRKVTLLDTDHIFGGGGDQKWVWGQFMRGNNMLFMDSLDGTGVAGSVGYNNAAQLASGRLGILGTRKATERLTSMKGVAPHGSLSSTGYCLANPGTGYIVYGPNGGSFHVDLSAAAGQTLRLTWINVSDATTRDSGPVAVPPGSRSSSYTLTPPGRGAYAAVLTR